MPTKSKLKMALAADRGVDFGKIHLKKKEKAARKSKSKKGGDEKVSIGKKAEEEWEDVHEESEDGGAELNEDGSGSEDEVDHPMQVCSLTCMLKFLSNPSAD
jgi:rRNA-processing protein EBP2